MSRPMQVILIWRRWRGWWRRCRLRTEDRHGVRLRQGRLFPDGFTFGDGKADERPVHQVCVDD